MSDTLHVASHSNESFLEPTFAQRTITLACGSRRDAGQGKWKPITATFSDFATQLGIHEAGTKDGTCFLQGAAAGNTRKASAMIQNEILVVDLDSGMPAQDVVDRIKKAGLESVVYTTHSHLKDTSVLQRDHFFKWSGGSAPTADKAAKYLVEVKGMMPNIVDGCEIVDGAMHTEDGVMILVRHKPIPKLRAVFPLEQAFIFGKRGGTQQDAIKEWKERYAGFCTDLGLFFDEKCVDPARLFYFPRHPHGNTSFGSWHVPGGPLNISAYQRIKMQRRRPGKPRATAQNPFAAAAGTNDQEDDKDRFVTAAGFNLLQWVKSHGRLFEIETMLTDVVDSNLFREPRSGADRGTHVECPFEPEHSIMGGNGTFVVNAGDNWDQGSEGGFSFVCVHNACAGRDRLDFLKEMLEQGVITPDDLMNPAYQLQLEDDETGAAPTSAPLTSDEPSTSSTALAFANMNEDEMLRAMNTKIGLVKVGKGAYILVKPSASEEDYYLLTIDAAKAFYKNCRIHRSKPNGSIQSVSSLDVWMEWENCSQYPKGIKFSPHTNCPGFYNSFGGWRYKPKEGDWSLLRNHFFRNLCNEDKAIFEYVMGWMAEIIQNPHKKCGVSIVVQGKKGTGKTAPFQHLCNLIGRYGAIIANRGALTGNFNAHLDSKLLLVADEAFWAGDPREEGVLKSMITDHTFLLERKGVDSQYVDNLMRIVMISNDDWIVPASFGDERRFLVLQARDDVKTDFAAVEQQMENGGYEAMMHELMNYKPANGDWGLLRTAPKTIHLQEQQVHSLSGVDQFMYELLCDGIYEPLDDNLMPIVLNEATTTRIEGVELRKAINEFLHSSPARAKSDAKLPKIIKLAEKWLGARMVKVKEADRSYAKTMLIFPPLREARARATEKLGVIFNENTEPANDNLDVANDDNSPSARRFRNLR